MKPPEPNGGLGCGETLAEALVEHRHGGLISSRGDWVECLCGERLPCEFDAHRDPVWNDEAAIGSDYLAILRHQADAALAWVAARLGDEATVEMVARATHARATERIGETWEAVTWTADLMRKHHRIQAREILAALAAHLGAQETA